MRSWASFVAALGGLLAAAGASGWLAARPGSGLAGEAALATGLMLLCGAAALAPWLGPWSWAATGREALLLLVGAGLAMLLGLLAGAPLERAGQASLVCLGAWVAAWAWALPWRMLAPHVLGPATFLLTLGLACGTPWLAGGDGGAVPQMVLEWNPLLRLEAVVFSHDWLRGPVLYPLVGERYFAYPGPTGGLLIPGLSVLAALILSIPVAWWRHRARERQAPLAGGWS